MKEVDEEDDLIQEAAEQFEYADGIYGFKEGVKWQKKRSYNKKKVDTLLNKLLKDNMCSYTGDELIEQFKKKQL